MLFESRSLEQARRYCWSEKNTRCLVSQAILSAFTDRYNGWGVLETEWIYTLHGDIS